jgi:N-acetylglucosamine-6-phosphate deacetylase
MARLLIHSGTVVLPAALAQVDILIEGDSIIGIGRELAAPAEQTLDARGLTVAPGFIDIHVHGGGGYSFFRPDPEGIRDYAAWAPRNGVTSFLVSTIGRDAAETERLFASLAPAMTAGHGAEPLGFHLEGPFINPVRKGAFDPAMLRAPDPAEFERHQRAANGLIRQVTLAPELEGATALIRAARTSGAIAAMGHTDATTEQARAAFASGAGHVTHLLNAMRPIHQREGGPAVVALLESPSVEFICDGAHLAPEVVRMAFGLLGPGRTVIVTDNLHIAGTGRTDGRFGGRAVEVSGAKAVRDDGTIVGSVATMDQHVRNMLAFTGTSLVNIARMASANPARVAGSSGRKGELVVGKDADIVLLDEQHDVVATVCRGAVVYDRRTTS